MTGHLSSNDYMAHGFCFSWEPGLVWLHVVSDIAMGITYYSIPIAIFYFLIKRRDLPFYSMFLLFGIFILSCGTTHFFAAYTVFAPLYWPEGWVKAFTAALSVISTLLFIPVIPKAIALPSLTMALEEIKDLNISLEKRVVERTEELEESRAELEMQNEELRETYHHLEVETAERLRTMEELREKDRMLIQQSRMAAMGEMLGNIAHQWRQPLNVLGLHVQQIGLSYESGGFSKELLDANIRKAMDIVLHLSQTIDDFRNFSIPEKKKSLFRVDQVIAKTVSLIAESFKEQRIAIELDSSGEPQINGYPNEYAQVLLNILMNARDALLEQGMDDARVTIRSSTEDGRAVVTIADNAGGIKEEIMEKIFDPYFTTKDLGKGTGVGLFMSKTIIEKNMGGLLTARNVGDGAEFRIEV